MIVVNADCLVELRRLPSKSVDHVITDPPYEAHTHGNQVCARRRERSRHLKDVSGRDLSFPPITDPLREEYAHEIVRVTKGWAIVFSESEAVGKWHDALVKAGAAYRRTAVWVKPGAMPQFSGDRPAQGYELFCCAWCGPLPSCWNGGGKAGVYYHSIPRGDDRIHETQKPFGLMLDLVRDFTNPGDLVLDPFSGSGTTLLAAKALGRKYFGYELNAEYCRLANERLMAQALMSERDQLVLFSI